MTGIFITSDADKHFFAIVPLINATREQALERAKFHTAETFGVVPLRNGSWGIRVKSETYDAAAAAIRPDDFGAITGPVYELSGWPLYTTEEGVAEFLGVENPVQEVRGNRRYG